MARGKRTREEDAGHEWKVRKVWAGADPDDWEFYPIQPIPKEPPKGSQMPVRASGVDAFFKGSRDESNP